MPRYNRLSTIYVQSAASQVGLKDTFTQPGHNLQPGTAVFVNSSGNLEAGIASSISKSNIIGVVESVNGSDVVVVYQGNVEFPAGATSSYTKFPLVTGNTYYLSDAVTGGITAGYSTSSTSSLIKPILIPYTGYSGIVINSLPLSTTPLVSLFTPVGSIVPYVGGGSDLPAGWLVCAGDSLEKSGSYYNALYDIVGEKYSIQGLANSSTTGQTASVYFNSSVYDAPTEGPGSSKNHSILNNEVYKMVWGTNQTVVRVYSATGTTNNVTFKYLSSITGSTSFNNLTTGTQITLKSLLNGEASGYTSSKFFLPDLRGRTVVGAGTALSLSSRTPGDVGGEETHYLTENELPSHSHAIRLLNSTGVSGSASYLIGATNGNVSSYLSSYAQAQAAFSSATGGGDDHENMPPFGVANWIIRYKTNEGQPGIEVGPKGARGATGAQGIQGSTGPTGSIGVTGAGLGVINYTYTNVSSIPDGCFSFDYASSGGYLRLSAVEHSSANVGNYISTVMTNNNTQRAGIVVIRPVVNSSSFLRIYELAPSYTVVNANGLGIDTTHYRLNIQNALATLGNPVLGQLYSVTILPSANEGSVGAQGATGATGSQGVAGVTGSRGATGDCGCTSGYYQSTFPTVYVSPAGDAEPDLGSVGPHNFSTSPYAPTLYSRFISDLDGNWGSTKYAEETDALWQIPALKRYFNSAISVTSQPCGGNCKGSSGYISLCDTVRDSDSSNYHTPPKETNIVLTKDSENSVFSNTKTNIVNGCRVNVYASSDSFFSKIPTGLSAGLLATAYGSTGRNRLVVDVFMDTLNVAAGNYIGIRPEYFALTLTASATGPQSLAGIYKIDSISSGIARAYTDVPFGISGSDVFSGYITGGASNDLRQVDIYTVSVNFTDCSGYLVNSGELSLGLSSQGDPFVISFEGTTASSQASKAVISTGSGIVRIGDNMAFYGWPEYGSALYATRNGSIESRNNLFSKCKGTAIQSDRNGSVILEAPIMSSNNFAIVAKSFGTVEIEANPTSNKFTNICNNATIGFVNTGEILIRDSYAQLLSSGYQAGFYYAGTSKLLVEGDVRSIGLTGGIGLSSIAIGGSGGASGNSSVQPFLNVSSNSSGDLYFKVGNGKVGLSVPSTSSIVSYVMNLGKGKNSYYNSGNLVGNGSTLDATLPITQSL
jgi:microcystin-dependent protein